MAAIEAILFDLGNVFISWDARRGYLDRLPDPAAREHFLTHVCSPLWNLQVDMGKPREQAIAELCARHPDHKDDIEAWPAVWPDMFGPPIRGTWDILDAAVAQGLKCGALTNWPAEGWWFAERNLPLDKFADVIVSGHEGVAKPDKAIYRIAIERLALDPAKTVFIDDSALNVQAAAQMGFQALKFTEPGAFRVDLERLGVML